MSRQSLEDALYAWAANERNALHLGYPSSSAESRDYQSGYRVSARIPSLREVDVLRLVERGVNLIRTTRSHSEYRALVVYYWANEEDSPDRSKRIENHLKTVKKRDFYRDLKAARDYLQGAIDAH